MLRKRPTPLAREVLAANLSEADLQRHVAEMARATGWLAYHTHRSDRSEPGFPDWIFLRGGDIIVAELKAQGRKPTVAQERWLHAFAQVPCCRVFVWRPSDWYEGRVTEALR